MSQEDAYESMDDFGECNISRGKALKTWSDPGCNAAEVSDTAGFGGWVQHGKLQ